MNVNEIFHVYNRGVDKRVVFTSSEEYAYFVHILYALNDSETTNNNKRLYENEKEKLNLQSQNISNEGSSTPFIFKKGRRRLVDIFAFVLMENHYHLLLREKVDDGISKFMHKIGTAYTLFFNKKHNRSGSLFQGRYKSVHIQSDSQLLYIPHYLHLNPVKGKAFDTKKEKLDYLKNYKWSSYIDYIGGNNFPSVTQRELVLSLFGDSLQYNDDLLQFLTDKKKFNAFSADQFIDY